jgi:hypothetical protein
MRLFGVKVVGNPKIDGTTVRVAPLSWLFCAASVHPPAAQRVVDTFRNAAGHTVQEHKCYVCGSSTFVDVSLDVPSYRDEITLVPN